MPGGKGNINGNDGKKFSSDYQPKQKWTEEAALKLGNDLIDWLRAKDEKGIDKGNLFYEEFLIIENDYYPDLICYLCKKFSSFSDLIERAAKIQEIKLQKYGVADTLNATMTKFVLVNKHNWRDKQDVEHTGRNGGPIETRDLSNLSDDELRRIVESAGDTGAED